jgi:GH15 family glucan-1,4-alpha-glucosidase
LQAVTKPPPPKIQDYAIIGNGRSTALISNCGSIDWLCWPRFDSDSIFAAILDPIDGGHWSIQLPADSRSTRRYIDNTNVLQTVFASESAKIILTDFMPVTSEERKRTLLWPEHELIREVKCEQGEVALTVEFDPRLGYGRVIPKIKDTGKLGWRIEIGTIVFILQSSVELTPSGQTGLSACVTLRAGDVIAFSLTFAAEAPAVVPPLGGLIAEKLNLTIDWWRSWVAQSDYHGPYDREVIRSTLVLKLLSYAPSGAIIAAPTTSLPEKIGSDLNWDYRFAWLRDAAFTVRALFGLGYRDDAEGFVNWLLHATRLTRPRLRVLYDVFGETPSAEHVLGHLRGYADSRPVRVGNQARDQFQLDIYGEVVEAVGHFFRKERQLDHEMQQMLRQCGQYICEHWNEPDNGMWEYREKRRHYTHSRLLCWVALDRLLQMQKRGLVSRIPDKFKEAREKIRREIEQRAWNDRLQTYTQELDGNEVGANVLLLTLHGFEKADSMRMQQTYRCLRQRLSPAPGLLYRDEQSVTRGEGAFALCSFWEIDFLARGGATLEEAQTTFRKALGYANDLGLFAEEIDPKTGGSLGNFPQAFTHLGVINAALSLNARKFAARKGAKRQNELE